MFFILKMDVLYTANWIKKTFFFRLLLEIENLLQSTQKDGSTR